jgi:putative oxidoreductase
MANSVAQNAALVLLMLFFAITFLQSAWDKIADRKGNLEFLTSHFRNTPFRGQVGAMLSFLTVVEILSGVTTAYGAITSLTHTNFKAVFLALIIVGVNLLMLLTGQRLAKDYAGAASLAGYFTLVMAGFILLSL